MKENSNNKNSDTTKDNKQFVRHFGENTIVNYKKLKDVKIHKMNRINIFAGNNNTGKTSLLNFFYEKDIKCIKTLSTPYWVNPGLLRKAYNYADKNDNLNRIIDLIQKYTNNSEQNIDLDINFNDKERFMENNLYTNNFHNIAKYGIGLQRIFEIALLITYSKDGITCIDDIEYGIHKKKFNSFTKFIQETAEKFNVQVFLTTHSKEFIDAFILNGHDNDSITGYNLKESDGQIECKYIGGERLNNLIEFIDFDIR